MRSRALASVFVACACRTVVPDTSGPAAPEPETRPTVASAALWPDDGFSPLPQTRCRITSPPPAEPVATWTDAYVRVGKAFGFAPTLHSDNDTDPCGGRACEPGAPIPIIAVDTPDDPAVDAAGFARPHDGVIDLWPDLLSAARQYHCTLRLEGTTEAHGTLRVARLVRLEQLVVAKDAEGRECEIGQDADCLIGCYYGSRVEMIFVQDLAGDRSALVEITTPLDLATEDPGPATQIAWSAPGVPMRGCDDGPVKLLP